MKSALLIRASDNTTVVTSLQIAHSVWERARGLLMRAPLKIGEGLLLAHCRSIHTIGMTYPLDIVFLDKSGVVRKCVSNVKALRFAGCLDASATLELPVGGLAHSTIQVGEQLRVVETGNTTRS